MPEAGDYLAVELDMGYPPPRLYVAAVEIIFY
jgi:hypothetical protein